MHVPGNLAPTLFAANPALSKIEIYHGLNPADLKRILPFIFRILFKERACTSASSLLGSNQSMLSIICRHVSIRSSLSHSKKLPTTAWFTESGAMRAITFWTSSVCMRSPSNASGFESLACALADRYCGWHLCSQISLWYIINRSGIGLLRVFALQAK